MTTHTDHLKAIVRRSPRLRAELESAAATHYLQGVLVGAFLALRDETGSPYAFDMEQLLTAAFDLAEKYATPQEEAA